MFKNFAVKLTLVLGILAASLAGFVTEADAAAYVVQKGDTLYSLAKANDVTVNDLTKLNKLKGTSIKVGQTLELPEKSNTVTGVVKKIKGNEMTVYSSKTKKNTIITFPTYFKSELNYFMEKKTVIEFRYEKKNGKITLVTYH